MSKAVASTPVLLQPLNPHRKSQGYGVSVLVTPMLKTGIGKQVEEKDKEKKGDIFKWLKELIGNQEIKNLKYF